jgi:RHS repeat-associated protein
MTDGLSVDRIYSYHQLVRPSDSDFGYGWQGILPAQGKLNFGTFRPIWLSVTLVGGLEFDFDYSASTGQWTFSSPYPDQLRTNITALFQVPATDWRTFFNSTPVTWRIDFADGQQIFVSSVPPVSSWPIPVVPTRHVLPSGFARDFIYNDQTGFAKLRPTAINSSDGRSLALTWQANKITQILLPDNTKLLYTYDSPTTVSNYTDRLVGAAHIGSAGQTVWQQSYVYENSMLPYALTGVIDALGNRLNRYQYDQIGRATLTELADGSERFSVSYGSPVAGTNSISRTVVNPAGKTSIYTYLTNPINSNLLVSGVKLNSISQAASSITPARASNSQYTSGRMVSANDYRGAQKSFAYDTRNRPTTVTLANGTSVQRQETTTWNATFDKPDRVVKPGLQTDYGYDTQGRIISVVETDQTTHSQPYPTSGQERRWAFAWSALGKLVSINGPKPVDAQGRDDITSLAYDSQGNLLSETNGLGHMTLYSNHDANGRPRQITSPAGTITLLAYDDRGRVQTRTVKHPTDPAQDAVTSFTYDLAGQLTSATMPDTGTINLQYSPVGRLIAVVDSNGDRIEYSHDVFGNIASQTIKSAGGTIRQTVQRLFDDLGRLVSETLGPNRTRSWEYDLNDNPVRVVSARNTATQFAFDPLDRLVSDTDELNKTASTSFNGQDDPITRTDRKGVQTSFVRNGFGDIIQETSPDRGTWVYRHDAAGDLVQSIDGRGQQIDFDRDILGRVIAKRPAGLPAQDVTYMWDTAYIGRLASITDNSGSTSYSYDHRGNVTAKQVSIAGGFTGTVSYAYDRADRIIRIVYPSGRHVNYNRNTLGQVIEVTLQDGPGAPAQVLASNFAYEPIGPLKAFSYGNGLSLVQDWGNDRRLYAKSVKRADGSDVWAKTYAYDNDDNIIAIATPGTPADTQSFTYDAKSRLVQATGPYGDVAREDYGYDDNDNRLTLAQRDTATTPNPTRLVTSTIAAGSNRLASQSIAGPTGTTSRSFTYNGRGDVTAETRDGTGVTASYDAYGRLATYTRTGTPSFAMLYSGTDERVQVSVDGTPRRFVHDESGRVIGEYGATGTTFAEHIWLMPDTDEGGWEPLALLGATTLSYVHGDHLGVPVQITDASGTTVNAMQADPFGQRFYTASTSAPRTSLALPGQIIDIADRHYNLYRDYDPTLGRYLQADPIGLEGGDNVYGYVGGNPLTRTDPLGLACNGMGCYTTPLESAAARSGNYDLYYGLACAGGDDYACYARRIAANDNISGDMANRWLDRAIDNLADRNNQCIDRENLKEVIRKGLARRYANYLPRDPSRRRWPTKRAVAQIHWDEFGQHGLPPSTFGGTPGGKDWPYVPSWIENWCPNCK